MIPAVAVVSLAVTIPDLRPDSRATAAPYFSDVIQLLTDSRQNGKLLTSIPSPGPIDAMPLPFIPFRGTANYNLALVPALDFKHSRCSA